MLKTPQEPLENEPHEEPLEGNLSEEFPEATLELQPESVPLDETQQQNIQRELSEICKQYTYVFTETEFERALQGIVRDTGWVFKKTSGNKTNKDRAVNGLISTMGEKFSATVGLLEVDPKEYLKGALKYPGLFHQAPATLNQNIRALVKKFEDEGLTVKDYLRAAFNQPFNVPMASPLEII